MGGIRINGKKEHYRMIPDSMTIKEAEIPLTPNARKVWSLIKVKLLDATPIKTKDGIEWELNPEGYLSQKKIAKILHVDRKTVKRCLDELKRFGMIDYFLQTKTQIKEDGSVYKHPETRIKINIDASTWSSVK
jgi:predicted HTH transcriptional regulator